MTKKPINLSNSFSYMVVMSIEPFTSNPYGLRLLDRTFIKNTVKKLKSESSLSEQT